MTDPTPHQLRSNIEITFRDITLRGDLLHVPELHQLVISGEEGEEVLTTETPESDLQWAEAAVAHQLLPHQVATIKDYSEHSELAAAMAEAGIIRILSRYTTGPFSSEVVVAEVL